MPSLRKMSKSCATCKYFGGFNKNEELDLFVLPIFMPLRMFMIVEALEIIDATLTRNKYILLTNLLKNDKIILVISI